MMHIIYSCIYSYSVRNINYSLYIIDVRVWAFPRRSALQHHAQITAPVYRDRPKNTNEACLSSINLWLSVHRVHGDLVGGNLFAMLFLYPQKFKTH